ncbi:ParB/RepB/Spo0J family partition protein [Nocardioides sp. R-C-SC26]|uniref:ParB/RepB/Spo0J family partition protein n=1 Tax=Nocardioides sp. R-C-SC26 TaxID=2870414 RepID=UPI0035AB9443
MSDLRDFGGCQQPSDWLLQKLRTSPEEHEYDYVGLMGALRDGNAVPPIAAFFHDRTGSYRFTDGFHRVAAASALGWTTILAIVRPATPDENFST